MGRIATSSPSSFNFVFIIVMLSLFLPLALARSSLPSRSDPHDQHSVAAKQGGSWPCCDNCGLCTKSYPPLCQCFDLHLSCPPGCIICVKETADPTPMYRCEDFKFHYAKFRLL
ncbi:Bowman-Birk type trypsin inhibitor [Rhynchospora pubera]|uniref:Bowman-Birk type trypsin inhibitor n=1 Tax=Rhynchospora pubera TaxID=906938 RepID=A0AAV8EDH5_9POAL|nr:Bowman-Birk type trypsin inhibitor [Rhynchospora pubera]